MFLRRVRGSVVGFHKSGRSTQMVGEYLSSTYLIVFDIFALWQGLAYLCRSPDNPALALSATRWHITSVLIYVTYIQNKVVRYCHYNDFSKS